MIEKTEKELRLERGMADLRQTFQLVYDAWRATAQAKFIEEQARLRAQRMQSSGTFMLDSSTRVH